MCIEKSGRVCSNPFMNGVCVANSHMRGSPLHARSWLPCITRVNAWTYGFRADIIVESAMILEINAVAALLPAHEAQLQTYLRMSRIRIGLIMNFAATRLKDGLRRLVV